MHLVLNFFFIALLEVTTQGLLEEAHQVEEEAGSTLETILEIIMAILEVMMMPLVEVPGEEVLEVEEVSGLEWQLEV